MINKSKITVTIPIIEYEELTNDVKWWQDRFNSLRRIVLKYAKRNDEGVYIVEDCVNLANDIETYLNDEDY